MSGTSYLFLSESAADTILYIYTYIHTYINIGLAKEKERIIPAKTTPRGYDVYTHNNE